MLLADADHGHERLVLEGDQVDPETDAGQRRVDVDRDVHELGGARLGRTMKPSREDARQRELAVVTQLARQAEQSPVLETGGQGVDGELHVGVLTYVELLGHRRQPGGIRSEMVDGEALQRAAGRRQQVAEPFQERLEGAGEPGCVEVVFRHGAIVEDRPACSPGVFYGCLPRTAVRYYSAVIRRAETL